MYSPDRDHCFDREYSGDPAPKSFHDTSMVKLFLEYFIK
jgi:hypothetical protein